MRHLSAFLELDFDEILLVPTFNGSMIQANTSFNASEPGIVRSTLARYKTLNNREMQIIEEITEESYQKVINLTCTF
jgi:FixJ family two-component response regulator